MNDAVLPVVQKVMARPRKSAESRPRAVAKNTVAVVAADDDQRYQKSKRYTVIKSLIKKRMKENPGVFEALKGGSILICLFCRKPLHPKKSNVDEHIATASHVDSVATLTVEGEK